MAVAIKRKTQNEKKLIIILLVALTCISLVGCNGITPKELQLENTQQQVNLQNHEIKPDSEYVEKIIKYYISGIEDGGYIKGKIAEVQDIAKVIKILEFSSSALINYVSFDLNDDGKNEIILTDFGSGSDLGWPLEILDCNSQCKNLGGIKCNSKAPVLILKTKTNGFHDIYIEDNYGGSFLKFDKEEEIYQIYNKKTERRY